MFPLEEIIAQPNPWRVQLIFLYLLRGAIVDTTHGTHKNLNISQFLLTIFGCIYYGPLSSGGCSYYAISSGGISCITKPPGGVRQFPLEELASERPLQGVFRKCLRPQALGSQKNLLEESVFYLVQEFTPHCPLQALKGLQNSLQGWDQTPLGGFMR